MSPTIAACRLGLLATGRNSDFPRLSESKAAVAWRLETLTTRDGRNKLGLTNDGQRVCDISIFSDADEARARFIARACNNHDALVEALTAAIQQANEALSLGATGTGYWEDLLETIQPALEAVQS